MPSDISTLPEKSVSLMTNEYEDEDTTYEYDETDWDKPPIKRLNK